MPIVVQSSDLSGAVILAPSTSSRNVITPSNSSVTALTVGGTFVVRQYGGVAGTDEVQISHDGTHVQIKNMDPTGEMRFVGGDGSNNTVFRFTRGDGSPYASIDYAYMYHTGFMDRNNALFGLGLAGNPWLTLDADGAIKWSSVAGTHYQNHDTHLKRGGVATLQMGVDAGTAIHQTFKAHNATGSNTAAANLVVAPGQSTGNATPASIILQSTGAGSSGSTAQTLFNCVSVTNGYMQLVRANGNLAFKLSNESDHAQINRLYIYGAAGTNSMQLSYEDGAGSYVDTAALRMNVRCFPGSEVTIGNINGQRHVDFLCADSTTGVGSQVRMATGVVLGWTDGAASGTLRTGLGENAAGVVEINNGTPGTYRDAILRKMISYTSSGNQLEISTANNVDAIFNGVNNSGTAFFYFKCNSTTGSIGMVVNTAPFLALPGNGSIKWEPTTSNVGANGPDLILGRPAAATLQMGVDAGTAIHQTLKAHNATGSNTVAANLILTPGKSTGNATPASVIIQSSVAVASGSTEQTLSNTLIVSNGRVGIGGIVPDYLVHIEKAISSGDIQLRLKDTTTSNVLDFTTNYNSFGVGIQGTTALTLRDNGGCTIVLANGGGIQFQPQNGTPGGTWSTGLFAWADATHHSFGTTTGTKLGTATTQKLAFWNATPITQPAGIADSAEDLAELTTKFNSLLSKLEALGLLAVA